MHIVLCCNQGMSTSMLVKKMREAAAKNGVDVQIDAYPISEIEEKAPDAAVILLGPQVRFELNRVKGLFPNIPVESINPQDYGLVRGEHRRKDSPMADAPETLDMEVLCMQMIVDAGSAKSDYMEALQAVKAGDYETAAAKMKSGDEQYAAGHEQHAKLVQQEAAGDPVTMSLLLTHVEDQMMSTETVKLMVTELIDLYRKLNG